MSNERRFRFMYDSFLVSLCMMLMKCERKAYIYLILYLLCFVQFDVMLLSIQRYVCIVEWKVLCEEIINWKQKARKNITNLYSTHIKFQKHL